MRMYLADMPSLSSRLRQRQPPDPDRLRSLLKSGDENQIRIIENKIQEVPIEERDTKTVSSTYRWTI